MRTRAVLVREKYDSDRGYFVEAERRELVFEDYHGSSISLGSDETLHVKIEGGWLVIGCSEAADLRTVEGDEPPCRR